MGWSNIEDAEVVKSLNRQDTLKRPLAETSILTPAPPPEALPVSIPKLIMGAI
jgi:hypothetical protein